MYSPIYKLVKSLSTTAGSQATAASVVIATAVSVVIAINCTRRGQMNKAYCVHTSMIASQLVLNVDVVVMHAIGPAPHFTTRSS